MTGYYDYEDLKRRAINVINDARKYDERLGLPMHAMSISKFFDLEHINMTVNTEMMLSLTGGKTVQESSNDGLRAAFQSIHEAGECDKK